MGGTLLKLAMACNLSFIKTSCPELAFFITVHSRYSLFLEQKQILLQFTSLLSTLFPSISITQAVEFQQLLSSNLMSFLLMVSMFLSLVASDFFSFLNWILRNTTIFFSVSHCFSCFFSERYFIMLSYEPIFTTKASILFRSSHTVFVSVVIQLKKASLSLLISQSSCLGCCASALKISSQSMVVFLLSLVSVFSILFLALAQKLSMSSIILVCSLLTLVFFSWRMLWGKFY